MQTDYFAKWKELDESARTRKQDETVIKYLPTNAQNNIFISNNCNNERSFLIEFSREWLQGYTPQKVNGLVVSIHDNPKLTPSKLYLEVKNSYKENDNAYIAFSVVFFNALDHTSSDVEALAAYEETVSTYHDFFKYRKELSKEEEQGIIAELLFLKDTINKKGETAVNSWFGCEKNKRDFIFGDLGVEIKSSRNQEQDIIHVSNENQLDVGTLGKLELKLYIFDENSTGHSVQSCISNILQMIHSAECRKEFLSKICLKGINPISYEGRYRFSVEKIKTYVVDDAFPKLTKENIPSCAFDVKYQLNISNIPCAVEVQSNG